MHGDGAANCRDVRIKKLSSREQGFDLIFSVVLCTLTRSRGVSLRCSMCLDSVEKCLIALFYVPLLGQEEYICEARCLNVFEKIQFNVMTVFKKTIFQVFPQSLNTNLFSFSRVNCFH